ncbi:MAG: aldo/keto reductase [Pseudomonadota bacterium]
MTNSNHLVPPGPLGFGGAPLGNMFSAISDGEADQTLTAAWDAGIRYFDTAPAYGSGISEHRFGHALRAYPREQFVLSTKVGRMLVPDASRGGPHGPFVSGLPFRIEYDYSADGARRSIEDSLQRLGMARIDIVYIHDIAQDSHGERWREVFQDAMDGAAVALTRLRDEGVIGAWGLGVNRVEPCLLALEQADPDVFLLAGRYSLLDQSALAELFPLCVERGAHVVVGGPYNSGLIAGGAHYDYEQAAPDKLAARATLNRIAARHGVDVRAAALQFCAAHPAVASVIAGTKHPQRVQENAGLMRQTIASDFWHELKREGLLPAAAPTPP